MAVKIRLSRIGKKNAPFYRIVAIDSHSKRDGASLEILGTYNPLTGHVLDLNTERIQAWVSTGAIPSDAVKKIQKLYQKQSVSAA